MSGDRSHWDAVYQSKRPSEVSWYQAEAALSLRLITEHATDRSAAIVDVGGGVSVLIAQLLKAGYDNLTVVEWSGAALMAARAQLGNRADRVRWIEGDICTVALPADGVAVWHDRAVFHFLTEPEDRAAYVRQLFHSLAPGGVAIISSFAEDGPTRCSGLEVRRYSGEALQAELGPGFTLVDALRDEHRTPSGQVQPFTCCRFRRAPTQA